MQLLQFLKKAKQGGYDNAVLDEVIADIEAKETLTINDYGALFLDPKLWESCGKVEGWASCSIHIHEFDEKCIDKCEIDKAKKGWKAKMHQMIDALCEGKKIKEYLKTL